MTLLLVWSPKIWELPGEKASHLVATGHPHEVAAPAVGLGYFLPWMKPRSFSSQIQKILQLGVHICTSESNTLQSIRNQWINLSAMKFSSKEFYLLKEQRIWLPTGLLPVISITGNVTFHYHYKSKDLQLASEDWQEQTLQGNFYCFKVQFG